MILPGFLPAGDCVRILDELAFAYWVPSTVVRPTRAGSSAIELSPYRVSETTGEDWFSPDLRRVVRRLESRLCRQLQLDRLHLEPWQATRYRRGGKFEVHLDGGPPFRNEPAGDREVTILVYLETPELGGSTTFPELGLDVRAHAGTVVAWTNLTDDGNVDPKMKHSARPVRKGNKVTLTTWSRQRRIRVPEPKE